MTEISWCLADSIGSEKDAKLSSVVMCRPCFVWRFTCSCFCSTSGFQSFHIRVLSTSSDSGRYTGSGRFVDGSSNPHTQVCCLLAEWQCALRFGLTVAGYLFMFFRLMHWSGFVEPGKNWFADCVTQRTAVQTSTRWECETTFCVDKNPCSFEIRRIDLSDLLTCLEVMRAKRERPSFVSLTSQERLLHCHRYYQDFFQCNG